MFRSKSHSMISWFRRVSLSAGITMIALLNLIAYWKQETCAIPQETDDIESNIGSKILVIVNKEKQD